MKPMSHIHLNVVPVKRTTLVTLNAPLMLESVSIHKESHLNKAHFSFNECRVPVSPDPFPIIASGKFRRDLQIKEAYFISLLKPKINVRYEKLRY